MGMSLPCTTSRSRASLAQSLNQALAWDWAHPSLQLSHFLSCPRLLCEETSFPFSLQACVTGFTLVPGDHACRSPRNRLLLLPDFSAPGALASPDEVTASASAPGPGSAQWVASTLWGSGSCWPRAQAPPEQEMQEL